ncbi:MAG: hypothetical protein IKP28_02150 [Clostridia bacterium]|nr:hypothetical protein [Clostridia bacterium]
MKNGKAKNGITLIALVITVIVLLILAGTAIGVGIRGDSLFNRTNVAVGKWNEEQSKEEQDAKTALAYLIPTAPKGIAKVAFYNNGNSSTLTVQACGGISYKYSIDNGTTWSESIPDGKPYTFTDVAENTEYTVIAKSATSVGESEEVATATMKTDYQGNIGKYVHYNVNLNIGTDKNSVDDDWIVFYEDETSGLTYLIAADYVPNTNSALTAARTKGILDIYTSDNAGKYCVCQNVQSKLKSIIQESTAKRNLLSWRGTINKLKHSATATLLDEDVWSDFVLTNVPNTSAGDIQAAGAATIDLWVASWNQKGYTPINISTNTQEEGTDGSLATQYGSGYYIAAEDNPNSKSSLTVSSLEKNGYNDKVYFPHSGSVDGCWGYWLASPGAAGSNGRGHTRAVQCVVCATSDANEGNILSISFTGIACGLRPIISLPSNIIGENSNSEIYYLGTNINENN